MNTCFLVTSLLTKEREHKMLLWTVCELPSTTPLPCQPAARPISLQYAAPPVDLVRMLFIPPQTNRIADEHLNYTASLSSQQRLFLLTGWAVHISPAVRFIHRCESLDRGLQSFFICITLCSDRRVRAVYQSQWVFGDTSGMKIQRQCLGKEGKRKLQKHTPLFLLGVANM